MLNTEVNVTTTSGAVQVVEHQTLMLVLGVSGLLALAVMMLPLASRLKIPYTVMLAAVGIGLGLISDWVLGVSSLGFLFEFIHSLHSLEITSEAVLFVFLPALVFESALTIHVRRLFDDIAPILMLAILGLMISTLVVGFTMSSITGKALIVCTLLGAIVSATDPVAVVAIFKDLGAPQRLAILVEGESLFNDATAIVAFTILSAMILGEAEPTVLSGLGAFLKVFLGGALIGYLSARVTCVALGVVGSSSLPKITLTICLAYLSFIIAEHTLHVSGVMAVVTAALVIGARGRSVISQSAWHGLEEVWEQIGFIANSVIFVLVGLKVPSILASMNGTQLFWLGALLLAGFAARFVIIFGLVPAMASLGWSAKVSLGYRSVMFWGGLRGAVSLALALAVMENEAFDPEIQSFVGVMVTGFVLFTLFINATTVQWVMNAFGLAKLNPGDAAVRDRAFNVAMSNISSRVQATARAKHIGEVQALEVVKPYQQLVKQSQVTQENTKISDDEWLVIGLRVLSLNENKAYHEMFDRGEVSPEIARLLFTYGADLGDSLKHGDVQSYVESYRSKLAFHWRTRVAMFLQRRLSLPRALAKQLAVRFQILEAECTVLHKLIAEGVPQVSELIGAYAASRLTELLKQRDLETEEALNSLRACYPEYANALEKRVLQQTAMRLEQASYEEMLKNSLISKEVAAKLVAEMGERYSELQQKLALDLGLDAPSLVAQMPFFQNLDAAQKHQIARLLKPRLALPDEVIFEKGGPPDAMYFISSGVVKVELEARDVLLGSGDFFGELALLSDQPRMAKVSSRGFSELLTLSTADFQRLLDADPQMLEIIERVAAQRIKQNKQ